MTRGGITICKSPCHELISYSNGGAYLLKRLKTGEAISIQYGDDATAFRALFDQLEDRPNATAASVLREMWNTYS